LPIAGALSKILLATYRVEPATGRHFRLNEVVEDQPR